MRAENELLDDELNEQIDKLMNEELEQITTPAFLKTHETIQ